LSIVTKTGDGGETGLFGGGRVSKDDPRVEAYGEVDELNAALGLARAQKLEASLDELLQEVQSQLFTVGAVLATPPDSRAASVIPVLHPSWAAAMEQQIAAFDREILPLNAFILPGGTAAASALHLARTICRRAERRVVPLARAGAVIPEVVVYLNRLSDLLFTLARVANHRAGERDVPWVSPKS
jgi:cob(I)alamin adenosyltransferase